MAAATISITAGANQIHAEQAVTTAEDTLTITVAPPGYPPTSSGRVGAVVAMYSTVNLWLRQTSGASAKFFVPAGVQFNIYVNSTSVAFTVAAQAGTGTVYYMTVG